MADQIKDNYFLRMAGWGFTKWLIVWDRAREETKVKYFLKFHCGGHFFRHSTLNSQHSANSSLYMEKGKVLMPMIGFHKNYLRKTNECSQRMHLFMMRLEALVLFAFLLCCCFVSFSTNEPGWILYSVVIKHCCRKENRIFNTFNRLVRFQRFSSHILHFSTIRKRSFIRASKHQKCTPFCLMMIFSD